MPPVKTAVPPQATPIYDAYLACLAARGVGNKTSDSGARCFLARFPDPQAWAELPLAARLAGTRPHLQPLLNFLMLHGHLRPGYDYLLDRKLTVILREAAASPLGPELRRFLGGAEALGYSARPRRGMASEVAIRLLIQTGRALAELTDADFTEFGQAITERETRLGRALKHYHHALYASRAVVYHLGAPAEPVPKRATLGRWSWERHLDGVPPQVLRPMVAYLERLQGTHARSSVQGTASELAHFGRFLARHHPGLPSLAALDRQRHIEPYLNEVAAAVNHRTGQPITASTAKKRIQAVGSFLDAIAEWDWPDAPARRLIFPRDAPKLPHPLPRYLPPDSERALLRALEDSPHRLRADALLLLRATGMRIGELVDLELDCLHEVPGPGRVAEDTAGQAAHRADGAHRRGNPQARRPDRRAPLPGPAAAPPPHRQAGRLPAHPPGPPRLRRHPARRAAPRRRRGRTGRRGAPPAQAHLCHRPGQRRLLAAGPDGPARARLRGNEPALWLAVRRHRPRRVHPGPDPGQSPAWPCAARRAHPAAPRRHHRRELAGRPADQGPAGRRLLPAHRHPGPLRLCQHLRALPELPLRDQLPARAAAAARRRRSPRRRRRHPRLGRRSHTPPPPHRTARPAHQQGPCQLTTSRPGSKPPAPSSPQPGSPSPSPK